MGWQFVAGALLLLIVVAVAVVIVLLRARTEPPVEHEAEDFLTEYFALEEFDDVELRERLEHLRGVPDLR